MVDKSLLLAAWQADKKLPVILLLLCLINLGLVIGLRSYVSPQLETLERTYLERQTTLRQSRAEGRAPQEPQEELWVAKDDLRTFWQAIPPRGDLTLLIGELFELASDAELSINQISYDPKGIEDRPLLRYGLTFAVAGEYAQVKRFIYSLEQSERLIAIENVALSSDGGQDQQRVNLNLKLSTLFRTGDL